MTSTTSRRLWRGPQAVALALALCALSLGSHPSPASAFPSIWLDASSTSVLDGTSVTLTAGTGYDVGPTAYFIEIYDLATGQLLNYCGRGTTCSATVFRSTPSAGRYQAYIGLYHAPQPPPTNQGVSLEVDVFWSAVAVGLVPSSNPPFTLDATSAEDVGPTPYYIEIYNLTTGGRIAICGTGTTCSGQAAVTSSTYQAFVAGWSTTPPASFQGASIQVILGNRGG